MVVAIGALSSLAALAIWVLAAAVWRLGRRNRWNRLLATLLFAEGLFNLALAIVAFGLPYADPASAFCFALAIAWLPYLYLLFVASLDTPLTAGFRRPATRRGLRRAATVTCGIAIGLAMAGALRPESFPPQLGIVLGVILLGYAGTLVFGLVASISALRRAQRGTPQRDRASAYTVAFALRDGMLIVAIASTLFLIGPRDGPPSRLGWDSVPDILTAVASLAFAAMLAYGILRTQLFDIDLRVKKGLRRSIIGAVFIAAFFIATEGAQALITDQTKSTLVGIVGAALLLPLLHPLQRLAGGVADAAMGNVKDSMEYRHARRVEVYAAAVESALEEADIDGLERRILDRLAAKLGLAPAEAKGVEGEVRARPGKPAVGRAAAAAPAGM